MGVDAACWGLLGVVSTAAGLDGVRALRCGVVTAADFTGVGVDPLGLFFGDLREAGELVGVVVEVGVDPFSLRFGEVFVFVEVFLALR